MNQNTGLEEVQDYSCLVEYLSPMLCAHCFHYWMTVATVTIDHFTVVGLVTWPLNDSEAGGDLVLIQTSLLLLCRSSCSYAN